MDAVMLCMKKRGIRFFKKIRFSNTDVLKFHEKYSFLMHLSAYRNDHENILIFAHGSNNSILTTSRDPTKKYMPYISEDDTNVFFNDFVFSVSCLTANSFGKKCIDNGAVAYLGYQVEFSSIFNSTSEEKTRIPKRISIAIDTVIKHIFIDSLAIAYEDFLTSPISVEAFKQYFSFLLEKELTALLSIDLDTLYSRYGIKVISRHYEKYIVDLVLRVLAEIKEILPRLVCLGDSNYISPSFVKYYLKRISMEELYNEINNNESFLSTSDENKRLILSEIGFM